MPIKQSFVKLTLERFITNSTQYAWRFRKESYTRQEWETFDIPCICGVAGIFCAHLNDSDEDESTIQEWKEKLKDKALHEMQNSIEIIMQQIESLGELK
ncbi:hypothetical protein D3C85_886810 [compost metagenome]